MRISIIIPVFNEENTIANVLKMVEDVDVGHEKEIVIVDDFSTDSTRNILNDYRGKYRIIFKDKNEGKGAALREGFKHYTGDVVIVQDADLEYDPKEYPSLIEPIVAGYADVVYGSRFVTVHPRRVLYYSHYIANKIITSVSNLFTGLNLSDMETGYKIFSRKVIDKIGPSLVSNKFGIEPEITARIAKHGFKVYEIGISYKGRTYDEGKKINWKDGMAAIWHIIRFNLFK